MSAYIRRLLLIISMLVPLFTTSHAMAIETCYELVICEDMCYTDSNGELQCTYSCEPQQICVESGDGGGGSDDDGDIDCSASGGRGYYSRCPDP